VYIGPYYYISYYTLVLT